VPGFSKPKTYDLFNPVQALPLVAAQLQLFQNPAAGLILRGQLDFYFVAGQQTDKVSFLHSDRVGQHVAAFTQINAINNLRQLFHY